MGDRFMKCVHVTNGEKKSHIFSLRNKEHPHSVARAQVKRKLELRHSHVW